MLLSDKPHGQVETRPTDQAASLDAAARARSEIPAEEQPRGRHDRQDHGASPQQDSDSWRSRLRRHAIIASAGAVIVIAAIVAGVIWWLSARQYESTDDAFIDARTVSIS